MSDEFYMHRALELARLGAGYASPNPLVGCVVVRDGGIIGEGYHRRYGGKHAETEAIDAATGPVRGATLYCNLEPCCHWGHGKHQPPCVPRIIHEGVSRVVIANIDPNPRVNGGGVDSLRAAGVEVTTGLLAEEGAALNQGFFRLISAGVPFVTLKIAQSLDGRIATRSGHSKWITDPAARRLAHEMRASADAVLVGRGTVGSDDPELTVRLAPGRSPLRVVLDSSLSLPLSARVFSPGAAPGTVVLTTAAACPARAAELRARGAAVVEVRSGVDGRVDLQAALEYLGGRGIASVIVEGGAAVFTSFVAHGLYDKLVAFISPMLIGSGIDALGDLGTRTVDAARRLARVQVERVGDQAVLTGYSRARSANPREEAACSRAS